MLPKQPCWQCSALMWVPVQRCVLEKLDVSCEWQSAGSISLPGGEGHASLHSAHSGFSPWCLTGHSRIEMVGVGVLHVLLPSIFSLVLFLNYHFQLCRSFLHFPPFCYSANVCAWTMLETPFRHCFHLTAPYVYFESKGFPASESLCCFLILLRQNYLTQREAHQGRLWLPFCLVYGTPVEVFIATLYLIACDDTHIKGRQMVVCSIMPRYMVSYFCLACLVRYGHYFWFGTSLTPRVSCWGLYKGQGGGGLRRWKSGEVPEYAHHPNQNSKQQRCSDLNPSR